MTLQLFDSWNEKKKITHQSAKIPYFNVKEIWWVQLGKNISSESLGKGNDFLRPVIILQKFYGKSALIIPLTSQKKEGSYYFSFKDNKDAMQTAILPQIRYVDGRRFRHQLALVPDDVFLDLQEKLLSLIKNNPQPEGGGS